MEKGEDIYTFNRNSSGKLGRCVIISNDVFSDPKRYPPRNGSETDLRNLMRVFEYLGFDVEKHENLHRMQIQRVLEKVAHQDNYHSDAACFVCCILTHGSEGYIAAYDGEMKLSVVFSHFVEESCPSLKGKPKLFFIQACRGSKLDDGITMKYPSQTVQVDGFLSDTVFPDEPDFLVAYSSVSDHAAWRNVAYGSWFIQELCRVLSEKSKEYDLLSMLTLVNQGLSYNYQSSSDSKSEHAKKQTACLISRLVKKVYFFKKNIETLV